VSGVLGGRPASVRSVAETPVTLLSIDTQDFLDVLEDRFAVFLQLRKFYAANVARLQRKLGVFHTSGPLHAVDVAPDDRPLNIVEQLLFLQRTSVFRGIPINVLSNLIRDEREVRVPAGEVLWRDGDAGTLLIAIVRGSVRCGTDAAAGSFVATPGYVLGADAALGGIPYCYDAVAETAVAAVSVKATALTDMIEDHFELGRRSLTHFAQEEIRLLARGAE
jgi:CRP-like cAMP-binding protein